MVKVLPGTTHCMIIQPNPSFYGWATVQPNNSNSITPVLGPMVQVKAADANGMNGALLSNGPAVVTPTISTLLSNYRVVAGGVTLRGMAASNVAQATSTMVPVLVQNSDLSWASLNYDKYNNTSPGYFTLGGGGASFAQEVMTGSIYNTTNILSMGGARSFTTYDLVTNQAQFNFTPVTPEAFQFHDCGVEDPAMLNTAGISSGPADIVDYDYSTQKVSNANIRGITDCNGWAGCMCFTTPAWVGTENVVYELDYILHVEGQPRMGGQPPPAMSSDILPSDEREVLSYAKQFRQVLIDSIVDVGSRSVKGVTDRALANLMSNLGTLSRTAVI